jgi:hypothetical protein
MKSVTCYIETEMDSGTLPIIREKVAFHVVQNQISEIPPFSAITDHPLCHDYWQLSVLCLTTNIGAERGGHDSTADIFVFARSRCSRNNDGTEQQLLSSCEPPSCCLYY